MKKCLYLSGLMRVESSAWLCVVMYLAFSATARADSTLAVTSNISTGSCEVRLFRGENATGEPDTGVTQLDSEVGSVNSTLLAEGGVTALREDTAVTLKMLCKGSVSGDGKGATPVVTASGTAVGGGAASYLFRGDGTAESDIDPRVGAVISTKKGGLTINPWTPADYIKPGTDIPVTGMNGGSAQGLSVTLYTGISCGDAASCDVVNSGPLQRGVLHANVSLDFAYK